LLYFILLLWIGGIPIQRVSKAEAVSVVNGVINLGINFLDTEDAYSDSEGKIGSAIKTLEWFGNFGLRTTSVKLLEFYRLKGEKLQGLFDKQPDYRTNLANGKV
jgi:predicted aldo/keto reductase-like oxidoreductase